MTREEALRWALQLVTVEASLASLVRDRKEALEVGDHLAAILREGFAPIVEAKP